MVVTFDDHSAADMYSKQTVQYQANCFQQVHGLDVFLHILWPILHHMTNNICQKAVSVRGGRDLLIMFVGCTSPLTTADMNVAMLGVGYSQYGGGGGGGGGGKGPT